MKYPKRWAFSVLLCAVLGLSPGVLGAQSRGLPDVTDPVAGMGVNIHFTDARPGELEMLAHAGFQWIRMDFSWEVTEKTLGKYDFSAYDRLLASLDHFHIRALLILDYGNPLYDGGLAPCTDSGRAAFARWAAAAAGHLRKHGVIWEIWNEPNGKTFWSPEPNAGDYAKLALTVNRAIHHAASRELVVGPALSGSNLAFVEISAKAGVFADWSAITIHPYFRPAPESYGPAYDNTRRLIKEYGKGRKITVLCGESGYSTIWRGMDDVKQGEYLARLFLFNVMSGVPLTIWYDWRDDGSDPKNTEHHFGIVHNEYHRNAAGIYDPKPAYEAAQTYSRELAGSRFKKRLGVASPNDFVLSFKSRAGECLVVWTWASAPHLAEIPAAPGVYTATSYDGKDEPALTAVEGKLDVMLNAGPQYLKKQQ